MPFYSTVFAQELIRRIWRLRLESWALPYLHNPHGVDILEICDSIAGQPQAPLSLLFQAVSLSSYTYLMNRAFSDMFEWGLVKHVFYGERALRGIRVISA